jgi:hypothetical protein
MSPGDELRIRPATHRQGPGSEAAAEGGGSLESLRAQGERLLAASDEAIDRALSGDSEAFHRANRQHGGQ